MMKIICHKSVCYFDKNKAGFLPEYTREMNPRLYFNAATVWLREPLEVLEAVLDKPELAGVGAKTIAYRCKINESLTMNIPLEYVKEVIDDGQY